MKFINKQQRKQKIEDRRRQRRSQRNLKAVTTKVLRRQKKIEAERKRQNVKELKIQREQKLRRRLLTDEDIYLLKISLKYDPLSFTEKCEIQYKLSLHDTELKRRARQVRNHKKYPGKRRRLRERFQKLLHKNSNNNNIEKSNEIITDWDHEELHDDNPELTVDEIVNLILDDNIENIEANYSVHDENTQTLEWNIGNIQTLEWDIGNIQTLEWDIENTQTKPDMLGELSPIIENIETLDDIENTQTLEWDIENIEMLGDPNIVNTNPRQCNHPKLLCNRLKSVMYVCASSPRQCNMFFQPNTFKGGGEIF